MPDPANERREWRAPQDFRRLDKAVAGAWPDLSRTALQRSIDLGLLRVDGKPARRADALLAGQTVTLERAEVKPAGIEPSHLPLEILFEDEHLLVVNKPSGLVVHPGAGTGNDTLVHRLLAHCAGGLSGIGGVERPGIVHRLDRETSGAIVAAKSDAAHLRLARAFHDRKVRKLYGVLVRGAPPADSGKWEGAIARHGRERHRMTVVRSGGRPALTEWKVHERFGSHCWILCDLKTGRTHQIRVHCQHARLPVLGDRIYGWKEESRLRVQPARVMLHARELCFRHPITGRKVECVAPWPEDFQEQVRQLRKGSP